MIIAIFIIDKAFGKLDKDIIRAYVFDTGDEILSLGDELLFMKNMNYVSSWLANRKIKVIYCKEMEIERQRYFENLGIKIKPLTALREDPLLQSLLSLFKD